MKYTVPEVEAMLKACGIDATPWQLEMLTRVLNTEGPILI